jgi:hypothetical protein
LRRRLTTFDGKWTAWALHGPSPVENDKALRISFDGPRRRNEARRRCICHAKSLMAAFAVAIASIEPIKGLVAESRQVVQCFR